MWRASCQYFLNSGVGVGLFQRTILVPRWRMLSSQFLLISTIHRDRYVFVLFFSLLKHWYMHAHTHTLILTPPFCTHTHIYTFIQMLVVSSVTGNKRCWSNCWSECAACDQWAHSSCPGLWHGQVRRQSVSRFLVSLSSPHPHPQTSPSQPLLPSYFISLKILSASWLSCIYLAK